MGSGAVSCAVGLRSGRVPELPPTEGLCVTVLCQPPSRCHLALAASRVRPGCWGQGSSQAE